MTMRADYDALLLVSFGGPEGPDEVMPFLENVVRGRPVPRERLLEVAEHYHHFGGKSPIQDQCRALLGAIEKDFSAHGVDVPFFWGNLNWHPLLPDTVRAMRDRGVRRAAAFVTSGFGGQASCRKYLDAIERARAEVGEGAPEIDKLRLFYDHPRFVEAMSDRVRDAFAAIAPETRAQTPVLFTAHSVPTGMANATLYVSQLEEACRLVSERCGLARFRLVYQSRSGPPTQPWLEPDVLDALRELAAAGEREVVLAPIGFVSDHMEVAYDLDVEARQLCAELGLGFHRAATVGVHPDFVTMVRELFLERRDGTPSVGLGRKGPPPLVCPPDCCRGARP